MSSISVKTARLPTALPLATAKKVALFNRREFEPLLANARETLNFYTEAMGCSAVIMDRSGHVLKTPEYKNQMLGCVICNKPFHNPSCTKKHYDAMNESLRLDAPYVYTCPTGFIYWTSPLYRNGRYAGALTAGQVLLQGINTPGEKTAGKVPKKSHDEIQDMSLLLGVCAKEISETKEESGEMIDFKTPTKKSQPSSKEESAEIQLEEERALLAAFRRGDNETGSLILKKLMNKVIEANAEDKDIIQLQAIELMVIFSRAAAIPDVSVSDGTLENNIRYLKRIQESKSPEELVNNLNFIAKSMAGNIFSFQGIRHASVLLKAERYIWENYTRKISLEEIAKASGLSAPYFCTVFKEEMGENLSNYLNRLRVEKAAALLTETGKPLNEIAGLCGFEDQSWFSKIFKNFTGMSPGKYREYGSGGIRKI